MIRIETKFQYIKLQMEIKREKIKQILCYRLFFIHYDILNFIHHYIFIWQVQGEQILKKDRDWD